MTQRNDNALETDKSLLSDKPIPVRERLIFALDVPTNDEAKKFVEALGDSIQFYKLGLELFMADGYFETIHWLTNRGKKVFVDLKFFDVPNTVASAVRQLKSYKPTFATVHGNDAILAAACKEKGDTKILAVTVLTSLDQCDIRALGFNRDMGLEDVKIEDLVYSRAKRALELGCDGVISSGMEVRRLRQGLGNRLTVVVPGIRPIKNTTTDDQKRTVDVEEAFENGADYIVVGRPIKDDPDPRKAAEDMQERIAKISFPASSR
jgi:orotidine-5'-phosphate decarboxylase